MTEIEDNVSGDKICEHLRNPNESTFSQDFEGIVKYREETIKTSAKFQEKSEKNVNHSNEILIDFCQNNSNLTIPETIITKKEFTSSVIQTGEPIADSNFKIVYTKNPSSIIEVPRIETHSEIEENEKEVEIDVFKEETEVVESKDFFDEVLNAIDEVELENNLDINALKCGKELKNDEDIVRQNNVNLNDEFVKLINLPATNKIINVNEDIKTEFQHPIQLEKSPLKRKRRRIILLQDDEDSGEDEEVNRNEILNSDSSTNEEDRGNTIQIPIIDTILPEKILENEKPKPRSKKESTKILKELQARALLQSAIIIPATDSKKRKKRIFDSDDEQDKPVTDLLEDIGLNCLNETEDPIQLGSILISEDSSANLPINEIQIDKVEAAVPIENPILPQLQEEYFDTDSSDLSQEQNEGGEGEEEDEYLKRNIDSDSDKQTESQQQSFYKNGVKMEGEFESQHNFNCDKMTNSSSSMDPAELALQEIIMHDENENQNSTSHNADNSNPARDSGNSTDSTNNVKTEQSNKDPFMDYSSSSSEEYLPNELYFGTPDKVTISPQRGRGRPRGRPPLHTSTSRPPKLNTSSDGGGVRSYKSSSSKGSSRGRRGRPPKFGHKSSKRRRNSSESSSECSVDSLSHDDESSDDDHQWKKDISKKHKNKYQHHQKINDEPIIAIKKTSVYNTKKKVHKDRFYDKSREIPNEVYFGDVQVPLHVLHSYGDTSDDKSDSEPERSFPITQLVRSVKPSSSSHLKSKHVARSSSSGQRGRPPGSSLSPSGDQLIKTMKKYLKAAGIKRVKFSKLWEGCKSNKERAEKILELLREKGLEGEPTLAKCKDLKKQILTKKEIEDLDLNAIIETEGRTRRSSGRAATRRCYTFDDEEHEAQQTLSKLKKVVDSDSDYDN